MLQVDSELAGIECYGCKARSCWARMNHATFPAGHSDTAMFPRHDPHFRRLRCHAIGNFPNAPFQVSLEQCHHTWMESHFASNCLSRCQYTLAAWYEVMEDSFWKKLVNEKRYKKMFLTKVLGNDIYYNFSSYKIFRKSNTWRNIRKKWKHIKHFSL